MEIFFNVCYYIMIYNVYLQKRGEQMISKVNSCAISGIDGYIVNVEVDMSNGIPSMDIVGLPDTAVKESKERVKAAVKNCEFSYPQKKIIVNLAPAHTKKEGAYFDLPITAAILISSGQLIADDIDDYVLIGELSLDGSLRSVNGVLPMALAAKEHGVNNIIVPSDNAFEAAVADGLNVYGAKNLTEVVRHLSGEEKLNKVTVNLDEFFNEQIDYIDDFADVKGQAAAKRALEVAAAGGHNLIMIGAPGSGKTMLAKRLVSILPSITFSEALEVTKIYSIAGKLPPNTPIMKSRPFRSPHHTISPQAITGGGAVPKPGEISLAHRGVLFLDEFPEFRKETIDSLRQPLEDGYFTVGRVAGSFTFPSETMLIASMNPCKCGYYGDTSRKCTCLPGQIQKYLSKISGPMLDRFDIHVEVPTVKYSELESSEKAESSAVIRERVNRARSIQLERYKNEKIFSNASLSAASLDVYCPLDENCKTLLRNVFEKLGLSARAHSRIIKVARTIADLDASENIKPNHIAEAIRYRSLDKKFWFNN